MRKFVDWFDPYDIYHVRAFRHLCNTGHWPEGFMPDDIDMGNIWQFDVVAKMADAWVSHKLDNEYSDI